MAVSGISGNPLRLIVVEDDETFRRCLADALEQLFGHRIVGQGANGLEMVEVTLQTEADLLVFDIHLPQLNGIDALRKINEQKRIAAVAVTGDNTVQQLRRVCQETIHGFLVKPFDLSQLGPTVELAHARFHEYLRVSDDNDRLQRSLENRKLIERAKGVLMRRYRWTEADAFRRLQRAAMNQRTTMGDLARMILEGKEMEL